MEYRNIKTGSRIAITLFVGLIALTYWRVAWADWYVEGAQYSCSSRSGVFEILPFDQSSEDPNPVVATGFQQLQNGMSNLRCRIGGRLLQAQIGVTPPQPRGMCMGRGYVSVESLSVNDVELLDNPIAFDFDCIGNDPMVNRIVVTSKKQGIQLKVCSTVAGLPDDSPKQTRCTTKQIDVDAIAAANAKVDHLLLDPQTQAAQSATRLPQEYDLAKVFGMDGIPNSSLPLCAHWSSLFVGSSEDHRHGYIAGSAGERVYLGTTNPQLCASPEGDGCKASAYLLAGDRVAVGPVCGSWTQIQYRPRVRSMAVTTGWVETARLYGVSPLNAGAESKTPKPMEAVSLPDQLLRAVLEKNIDEMKRLVAAGANPDGKDLWGLPLLFAIDTGDKRVVKEILDLGAQINLSRKEKLDACSFASLASLRLDSLEIFNFLLERGLNVNCKEPHRGATALIELAGERRLWRWEWRHRPKDPMAVKLVDPKPLIQRLIAAGANVNATDGWGQTALFHAVEANNVDVALLLLKSGASPNAVTPDQESHAQQHGGTPLMAALWEYQSTRDATMTQILLAHGADPNYRNESAYDAEWDETTSGAVTFSGQTVLTRAAQDGHYGLVKLLLERGADPAIPRQDGALAEVIAEKKGHRKIAELLKRSRQ